MEILDNYKEVFDNAIKEGILSENENDKIYAGNFMYMHTDNGVHYFKHIITRKYGYDKETIKDACELF